MLLLERRLWIQSSAFGHRNTGSASGDRLVCSNATVTVPETGNSGTARKTQDSVRKRTVAVPELQRIREPHRVLLTGDDVFAQVRFPNSSLTMLPLCPRCRSCDRMGAGSPKPGTSFVVGTATDHQGPQDSSAVVVPTKEQASWEPQISKQPRTTSRIHCGGSQPTSSQKACLTQSVGNSNAPTISSTSLPL